MKLILTAAGKYSRFHRFSYEIPKYLLPIKNRTMLHYILDGFGKMDTIFVGNKQDIRFSHTIDCILNEQCDQFNTLWIEDTSGQAETLMMATESIDEPFIVHNIDTILLNRCWPTNIDTDCVIDIFESSNREYSYVIEDDKSAKEIREKSVISNKASSGCYIFKDRSFKKYFDKDTKYISQLVNKMIKDGKDISTTELHGINDTIVMGTPEEYLASIDSNYLKER